MDFAKIQKRIVENKVEKGFNIDNIEKEFCFLIGEVSEAFEAFNKNDESLGSELADVAIYLLGISELLGIDLESEITKKMKVNESRKYIKIRGSNIKV